jgi:hypothetical protein
LREDFREEDDRDELLLAAFALEGPDDFFAVDRFLADLRGAGALLTSTGSAAALPGSPTAAFVVAFSRSRTASIASPPGIGVAVPRGVSDRCAVRPFTSSCAGGA